MRQATHKPKILVFASGRGSNFEALCKAVQKGELVVQIAGLVTNVPGCGAALIAEKFGIPVVEVPHAGVKRDEHERALLAKLYPLPFDWIVLAGYMRVFSAPFIEHYFDASIGVSRILNIHPSLLPAFPGINAYRQAFEFGACVAGATVHFVTAQVDSGPMVSQQAFEIQASDTAESVEKKGLALEHRLYAQSLQRLFHEKWTLQQTESADPRFRVRFES